MTHCIYTCIATQLIFSKKRCALILLRKFNFQELLTLALIYNVSGERAVNFILNLFKSDSIIILFEKIVNKIFIACIVYGIIE